MSKFSRREALGGVLASSAVVSAAAATLLAPSEAGAVVHSSLAPGAAADAATALRWLRRLRYASGDTPVYWWMVGTKYGVVEQRMTPLYDMYIATVARCRELADGAFEARSLEFVFNCAIGTEGRLLEQWTNPYTGETIPVNNVPVGPSRLEYSLAGVKLPTELPGSRLDIERITGSARVQNGHVWMTDDSGAVVTAIEGGQRPFVVNDLATYDGLLSDLQDSRKPFVDAAVSFTALTGWQRWMKMGDRPGGLLSRASGRKERALDLLPKPFLSILAARFPELYRDPVGALDRPAFRFER